MEITVQRVLIKKQNIFLMRGSKKFIILKETLNKLNDQEPFTNQNPKPTDKIQNRNKKYGYKWFT